jgi:hypothetical protein
MWILVIVFLNLPSVTVQELARYDTRQACQVERDRIGYEMAASYPYERDFVLECRVRGPQWRA